MFQVRPAVSPTPDATDLSTNWGPPNGLPGAHHFASSSLGPPSSGFMYGGDRSRGGDGGGGRGGGGYGYQPSPALPAPTQITPQPPGQPPLLLNNLAQHLNNPPAPSSSPFQGTSAPTSGGKLLLLPNGAPPPAGSEEEKIYVLITELLDPETRELALLELSKKREMYEDLALVLWGGFGESHKHKDKRSGVLIMARYHVIITSRNCQCLSCPLTSESDCARIQSGL